MKRSEALAPLSREHHDTLILAQLLKKNAPQYKGLPTDTEGKAAYAINQFNTHIREHFTKEEQVFDMAMQVDAEIDTLIAEIRSEHTNLTNMFNSLADATNRDDALDELGWLLESHVRKEERILFPMLEQYGSPALLKEIHILLH